MTALKEYARLESTGLWRATPEDQRREVVVSLGEATLTITHMNGQPITHWSLAAVARDDPAALPALYYPDGDPGETLELGDEASDLVAAIEKLRTAIEKSRPHPGRLRLVSVLGVLAVFLGLLLFWVPDALVRHAVRILPDIKRQEIGATLLGRIERVAGKACLTADAMPGLDMLARRTGVRKVVVLPGGIGDSLHLPGNVVLLNRALIEDYEDPAVAAGYVLAERARAQLDDPMARLLSQAGPTAALRLLTTGKLTAAMIDTAAEGILLAGRAEPEPATLLALFDESRIPSKPYAYAIDLTGESVLDLIEGDPMKGKVPPAVLKDREWILMQSVCGG